MFLSRNLIVKWENLQMKVLGPKLRQYAQSLYKLGARVQGDYFQEDKRKILFLF